MNDDERLDDDALADALQSRVGGSVSVGSALGAVSRRAASIRRRRAAATSGGALAVMALGAVALSGRDTPTVGTADGTVLPSADSIGTSTTGVSTTGVPRAGASASVSATIEVSTTSAGHPTSTGPFGGSTSTTTADDDGATTPTVSTTIEVSNTVDDATTTSTVSTTASTVDDSTTIGDGDIAPTTSTTTPTTTPVAPFTRAYQSIGGSITVTWNGSALTLDAVAPVSGFTSEIEEASSTRVRVRFRSDGDDARIEVRVDDGSLEVRID